MKFVCAAVLGMLFTSVSFAAIDPTSVPIQRFLQVTPDIFRGAHPSDQGLQVLAREGLKSDIDLENIQSTVDAEQGFTSTDGIRFFPQPMSGHLAPDDHQVDSILAQLNDSANYPLFVHCKYGEDRTGLIIGLYRVLTQKWTVQAAYQEMVQDGFHPQLIELKKYFDQKTAGH